MKPDFLILTFPKSGSTSLHETLKQHPDFCLPLNKETWYFSRKYSKGDAWYKERFWHCTKKNKTVKVGEISTEVLLKDEYIEKVHKTLPNVKIIVLLRDPLQRTVSHYYHSVREGLEFRPISEVIKIINNDKMLNHEAIYNVESTYIKETTYENECIYKYGYLSFSLRYHASIETLLKLYPRGNILFVLFERLIKEPGKALLELQDFLHVDPLPLALKRENVAALPRSKSLRLITRLPLLLYQKLNTNSWLDKIVPLEHKRKTRSLRTWLVTILNKLSGLSNKEFKKPPLKDDLRVILESNFRKELIGIDKLTGLSVDEYWPWYCSGYGGK